MLVTSSLLAQSKTAKPSDTGYQGKDEKHQNKIPVKCKADTNCVDETGVSLTGADKKAKAGATKQ
jgi:hypothetical protein